MPAKNFLKTCLKKGGYWTSTRPVIEALIAMGSREARDTVFEAIPEMSDGETRVHAAGMLAETVIPALRPR